MPAQSCPTCDTSLPVDPRFVTWCHACGWNLSVEDPATSPSRLSRVAATAGRRLGDRMAEQLAQEELAPRLTAPKVAAYAVAIAVHAFVLGLSALGIWLLVGAGLFLKIAGVLLLGLAYLMRPRLGSRPRDDLIERGDAATLYALVDEIAASLAADPVHRVVITADYNASWQVVGVRRERVLTLGLPLLSVLEPQERVALIAHELAHGVNGDSTRGLVVGSAIESLAQLYCTLVPPAELGGTELEAAELIVRPVLWLFAQPFRLLLLLELQLLLQDSKRAEYLADRLAAQTAGTGAIVGVHEKLLLERTAELAVHQYVVGRYSSGDDVFDALRSAVTAVPERELERRRRIARLEGTRLASTHPPTGKRIELLERRQETQPAVVADAHVQEEIDTELRSVRPALSRRVVEQYRAALAG